MSNRQSVILAMLTAGAVFVAAHGLAYVAEQNGRRLANPLSDNRLGGVEMAVGWATMFTFLVIASDFPPTSALAAAFAWLILIAVLFVYGVSASQNLIGLMSQTASDGNGPAQPPARITRPTPI